MSDLPDNLQNMDELDLLTALVAGEAEGEPLLGKIAVAQVVNNRRHDKRWPGTWQGVMLQPWQFSCFLPDYFRPEILKHRWESMAWKECKLAAFGVFHGYVRDIVHGANHYHAKWMQPYPKWTEGQNPVADIGQHVFYKL